jgi:hypothetical protein
VNAYTLYDKVRKLEQEKRVLILNPGWTWSGKRTVGVALLILTASFVSALICDNNLIKQEIADVPVIAKPEGFDKQPLTVQAQHIVEGVKSIEAKLDILQKCPLLVFRRVLQPLFNDTQSIVKNCRELLLRFHPDTASNEFRDVYELLHDSCPTKIEGIPTDEEGIFSPAVRQCLAPRERINARKQEACAALLKSINDFLFE